MARELIAFASRLAGRPINVVTDMPQIVAFCAGAAWLLVLLSLCTCVTATACCHRRAAKQGPESPWVHRRSVGLLLTTGFLAVVGRFLNFPVPRGTVLAKARPTATAPSLHVATFNLRGADIPDGIDAWNLTRKDLAQATLLRLDAPIVGTQEGWDYQLTYLTQGTPYEWVGEAAAPGHACHDSALVYDARAVELLASDTFWLSPTPSVPGSRFPDSALVRTATWGLFKLKGAAAAAAPVQTLFVLNTHLDHIGEIARRQQAGVICEQLVAIAAQLAASGLTDGAPLPLVVTGDFNALRGSGAWQVFADHGLVDSWRVTPVRVGNTVLSYHGFLGLAAEGHFYTAPLAALVTAGSQLTDKLPFTWLPADMHIDWILTGALSPSTPSFEASALLTAPLAPSWVEVVTASDGPRYPSDHYPIVAALGHPQPT